MAKNFIANIESQTLQKDNSLLKMKVFDLEKKLKDLQNNQNSDILSLKVEEIQIGSNIRDDEFNYGYEEIQELASDIEKNGQIQPVLISQDKYLLVGYRRFNAIKFLSEQKGSSNEILVYNYPKKFEDISSDELINIQLAENIQRRDIDNFQLSKLYNKLLSDGNNQQQLAERFKKSKGLISFVVKICDINFELIKLLKQFQIYGWSEKKFNRLNFSEVSDEKLLKQYENLKGIIGIKQLYAIAKQDSLSEQKKAFLKAFKNRLSVEELNSDFFSEELKDLYKEIGNNKFQIALKSIDSLKGVMDSLKKSINENDHHDFKTASNYLLEIENIFNRFSERNSH